MDNFDSFLSEHAKHQYRQIDSSTVTFEPRKKPKNPFYTSSDEETDGEEVTTPKIVSENYRKMGHKSIQKTFGEEATKKPIYLQLMLDGKMPVDQLMDMEMPRELKDELRAWDAKFPCLRVDGKCADECRAARDMRMLRRQIVQNIAREHLWPELQSVLSTKVHAEKEKAKKKHAKSRSPKPNKKGTTTITGGTVKLPPINRKFY